MNKYILYLLLLFPFSVVNGQDDKIYGQLGIGGNFITQDHIPFWLRSNQFGNIPPPGNSASLYGSFHKYYDSVDRPVFDWGAGLEGRVNVGDQTHGIQGILVQGYLKMAVSVFEIKAGRDKDVIGLMDTTLSSGSFAMSGNALGIPKVEISLPQYFEIPILGNILAFKGNFALGWLGGIPIQTGNVGYYDELFHQSSLYGRLGKPSWRFHLYGGFNHQVFFGNEQAIFGNSYKLTEWQTFVHVFTGKTYEGSKVGNHIGSIDLGAQYDFNNVTVFIYRQNFYDEGALVHLANIADGLNGLSIVNTGDKTGLIKWNKFLFEFFYSANQAGYPWSKPTASGDENYYNNYEFADGYSYNAYGIGNPLISAAHDTRPLPNYDKDYFNNNRVSAVHLGIDASVSDLDLILKATYSKNYGTFATSEWGMSTGHNRVAPVGIFPESNQFSFFLQLAKPLANNFECKVLIAFDNGQLLYNSGGFSFQITKSF